MNRDLGYELRAQQRAGHLSGTTYFTAGRGIGVPNGNPGLPAAPDQIYRPATPEEARAVVQDLAAKHADIVKVWVDPSHGKVPAMPPTIYSTIIDEAHHDRLHVAAHEYYLADARILVNDGIDVLGHSVRDQHVDDAFIQSMLQHHTWYTPTFGVDETFFIYATQPQIMQSNFFRAAAGPQLLAKLQAPDYVATTKAAPQTAQSEQDFANDQYNLKALFNAGVLIAFGTDSGATPGRIPGFAEHRELEDIVAAGLTPLQAITLATGNTGQLLHTLDPTMNLGLIAPGYSAGPHHPRRPTPSPDIANYPPHHRRLPPRPPRGPQPTPARWLTVNDLDIYAMQQAIAEAQAAEAAGEVPIGAVIVYKNEIIARGNNRVLRDHDPTAHAEIIALRQAGQACENCRLTPATAKALHPLRHPRTTAPMCAGAILHARIHRTSSTPPPDPKAGACGSVLSVMNHPQLNHQVEVTPGLLAEECSSLLQNFFRARRTIATTQM